MQLRDLYWTFRNFRNRVVDFLRYRRVTANMDERFRNATEEDLARCDGICIICREEMAPAGRNKKLACNHVFHMHCLRSAALCTASISALPLGGLRSRPSCFCASVKSTFRGQPFGKDRRSFLASLHWLTCFDSVHML